MTVRFMWSILITLLLLAACSGAHARNAEGHISKYSPQQGLVDPAAIAIDPERWDLARINAVEAWQLISSRNDTLVAVLDTGIDQSHQDLANRVVASVNFTRSSTSNDLNGHGTHIAGIIAANADNAIGTIGLAYNAYLLNVKVAEDDGSCEPDIVARGIIWAVDNGARVINVSLAIQQASTSLEDAINYAREKGRIVVAAAGNTYTPIRVYPAAYSQVIAVAATDRNDHLPRWSNRGDWVTLSAPGVDIYSTLPQDRYNFRSGTSYATALVSAEVALLLSTADEQNGDYRFNEEVLAAIKDSCDPTNDIGCGVGRINVLKAVQAIAQAPKPGR
jgi:thermitase